MSSSSLEASYSADLRLLFSFLEWKQKHLPFLYGSNDHQKLQCIFSLLILMQAQHILDLMGQYLVGKQQNFD